MLVPRATRIDVCGHLRPCCYENCVADIPPLRWQALYGTFAPSKKGEKAAKIDRAGCGLLSWWRGEKRGGAGGKGGKGHKKKDSSQSLVDVHDVEERQLLPTKWHSRRFGVCHNFVTTTMELDGGCPVRARPAPRLASHGMHDSAPERAGRNSVSVGEAVGVSFLASFCFLEAILHAKGRR